MQLANVASLWYDITPTVCTKQYVRVHVHFTYTVHYMFIRNRMVNSCLE
jgi:hypothetical protein